MEWFYFMVSRRRVYPSRTCFTLAFLASFYLDFLACAANLSSNSIANKLIYSQVEQHAVARVEWPSRLDCFSSMIYLCFLQYCFPFDWVANIISMFIPHTLPEKVPSYVQTSIILWVVMYLSRSHTRSWHNMLTLPVRTIIRQQSMIWLWLLGQPIHIESKWYKQVYIVNRYMCMDMLDVSLLGVIIETCNCKADGFQGHPTLLYLLMRNTKRVCWLWVLGLINGCSCISLCPEWLFDATNSITNWIWKCQNCKWLENTFSLPDRTWLRVEFSSGFALQLHLRLKHISTAHKQPLRYTHKHTRIHR